MKISQALILICDGPELKDGAGDGTPGPGREEPRVRGGLAERQRWGVRPVTDTDWDQQ